MTLGTYIQFERKQRSAELSFDLINYSETYYLLPALLPS